MIFKTLLKPIFTVELINDQHIHHHLKPRPKNSILYANSMYLHLKALGLDLVNLAGFFKLTQQL